MKKGEKILGLLMIALSIFGLAMFWSAADENTGVTAVRISPLLIALAAVAGLAMCGGLTRQRRFPCCPRRHWAGCWRWRPIRRCGEMYPARAGTA